MTEWKAKRFWTDVTIAETAAGFGILLDGRSVKTPAKADVSVPTKDLANAMAAEWAGVEQDIRPQDMPVTRSVNAAIDKVTPQCAEVVSLIAEYGGTDLLCYRADYPEALKNRQAENWDPILNWAESEFGARLMVASGVMPVTQSANALQALESQVAAQSPFELTALHDLVGLSGSLVLGLAVTRRRLDPESAWAVSRVDEAFQAEQWGKDEEAEAAAAFKKAEFLHAARFYRLVTVGE